MQLNISASLVYLSDHGENVYDEEGEIGHNYKNIIPKSLIEIPYIVWSNNKSLFSKLETAKNKPAISDDLFHHIIGLSNVLTPLYEKERDINNPAFNSHRPRVLDDHINYQDK